MERVAVCGGGSWGTALAWLLAGSGHRVALYCRDAAQAAAIERDGRNPRYLPDLLLPPGVTATAELAAAATPASLCILAVPLQEVGALAAALRPLLPPEAALLLAAKGLEVGSGRRGSEVVLAAGGPGWADRLAVLSGPNLAAELVAGVPSTTVVAATNPALARRLQVTLGTPFFRVYSNPDVAGVELGGALKNPVAIAAGISDGLGFGNNTKAALITRGLAEMTRLGTACGARAATFAGLSGLGDLVATCQSPLSRNYRLGRALGQGQALAAALQELGQVAEGVPTTRAAAALAARLGVELPITTELAAVLFAGKPPREAVAALMLREFRDESGDRPEGARAAGGRVRRP